MKRTLVAAGIGAIAVFAGILWFARETEPAAGSAAQTPPAAAPGERAESPEIGSATPETPSPIAVQRPVVVDPRVAALMGPPNDPLIEYVAGPDGRLIKEIDKDPNSQGYLKPLREYSYAGDKLVAIVARKYLGNHVQVIRARVTYNSDGSVDQYGETTAYEKP